MRSIRSTASSALREINARIRTAPSQLFLAADCTWLVLIDDSLLSLATGREVKLETPPQDLGDASFLEQLAKGAQALREEAGGPIGLLLPISHFIYTHYSVQLGAEHVANRELILSAIALQKDLLLPAMDEEFALVAGAGNAAGVAFWMREDALRDVEAAFKGVGLELAAILPRTLAAAPRDAAATAYVVADEDASSRSLLKVEGRVATRLLSALEEEFANDDVANAWAEQAGPLADEAAIRLSGTDDWRRLGGVERPLTDYLFYTREFLERVEQRNQQRKAWAVGAFAMAAALVLALPLVYQWVDVLRLEGARDAARQEARAAAAYQNKILGMEAEWGVVYEYPAADVSAVLTTMNSMIRNSLTSFAFDGSTVEIQGSTPDPEQLTKLLVAAPMFEDIEQTRSISDSNSGSGDRFGFKMTLAGSDYEQYSSKYSFK